MTKKEFTINVRVVGSPKKLNVRSDTNNIDYILEKVRDFLTEIKEE